MTAQQVVAPVAVERPAASDRASGARGALGTALPLVTHGEIDRLRQRLRDVSRGRAALVQVTGCGSGEAELRSRVRVLTALAVAIEFFGGRAVVAVSGSAPADRRSAGLDSVGLLGTYASAAAAMNVIRTLPGGEPDLRDELADLISYGASGDRFAGLVRDLGRGLAFGISSSGPGARPAIYSSRESWSTAFDGGLLRHYQAGDGPRAYACSTHLVWTPLPGRVPEAVTAGILEQVVNPVGLRVGAFAAVDAVVRHVERLDGEREPGKVVVRLGAGHERVADLLPALIEAVHRNGHQVVWQCDPAVSNVGVGAAVVEVAGFLRVHRELGTVAGGVHLDLTRFAHGGVPEICLGIAEAFRG